MSKPWETFIDTMINLNFDLSMFLKSLQRLRIEKLLIEVIDVIHTKVVKPCV